MADIITLDKQRICPILSVGSMLLATTGAIQLSGAGATPMARCVEKQCALWNETTNGCGLRGIPLESPIVAQ